VFTQGARLRCEISGRSERVTIESVREHKGRLLVALDEAPDATSAERFVGATFFASRELLDVEADEYLDVDLVGCGVRDTRGKSYGVVERVEHYPSSDMLIVGGKMLPMVSAFVRAIDLEKKEIVVDDLPAGLLDGEELNYS
jgi:16S rRNA processing protein RimM